MMRTLPYGRVLAFWGNGLCTIGMKFLCDEMLKGLARWLRAAGYDTEIANNGETDRALIEHARATQRKLITRDNKLIEFRHAKDTVCLLHCSGIEKCALRLKEELSINWLHQPFSRCLLCNPPLVSIEDATQPAVPDDVRDGPLFQCPECQRIYWSGGHVKRMRAQLERWEKSR